MFTTFKQRLILGIFVVVILSIPVGAYFFSEQRNNFAAPEVETPADRSISLNSPVTSSKPSASPAKLDLSNLLEDKDSSEPSPPTSVSIAPPPTIATTFGPTLNFKVTIEGRPLSNQAGKMFVGIAAASANPPQYVLSFNIDMPASGSFTGLSLAGLTAGTAYQAIIKGSAQIATSSAFTMDPNVTFLTSN